MNAFDLVVVTAANSAQARGYEAQLKGRKGFVVVPDPGDRRVGSLGATVNVLRLIESSKAKRVLICHSGGDAKRTVGYAALGKAFVPMKDGRPLIDHIIDEMAKLPRKNGVVVCCGDVIPYLDYAKVRFAANGVTGVAYPDGPWQARRHGVYIAKRGASSPIAVEKFLQKPEVSRGKFLIDTGIMFFDWTTAAKMRKLPIAGDIYEEFPKLLLDGFASFAVSVVPSCRFFHIGSNRELLKLLGENGKVVDGVEGNELSLAGDNIVTNVPAEYGKIRLAKGECLTALPLGKDKWFYLKYKLDDNFKSDGKWEKYALGAKMRKVDHDRLVALRGAAVVEKPLRIDLAGGWSDTPPICNEMGGKVLNAAVALRGKRPVKVVVKRISAPEVRVESVDLGKRGVLTSMKEIRAAKDPHDWCALVKSALTVSGYDLREGGLDIRISADVPKGSGMGTSSILGAALLEALVKILRPQKVDGELWREISELTLRLEKEMRTGGGWQDQLGALIPGVKIVESKPGTEQRIKVRRIPEAAKARLAAFLKERGLLYFTGQKRMARNVLRGVIGFYRDNPDGIAKAIVRRLKEDAEKGYKAILHGDVDGLCAAINGYWLSKKALDPGSTNPLVESIIARMAPWTQAVELCGAGGGGFMFVIARSKAAKAKIVSAFEGKRKFRAGDFYDFDIV